MREDQVMVGNRSWVRFHHPAFFINLCKGVLRWDISSDVGVETPIVRCINV